MLPHVHRAAKWRDRRFGWGLRPQMDEQELVPPEDLWHGRPARDLTFRKVPVARKPMGKMPMPQGLVG
jgi:hypothetical protein